MDDEPVELTIDEMHKYVGTVMNFGVRARNCNLCSKEFLPHYDDQICNQCFYDEFPKDAEERYYDKIREYFSKEKNYFVLESEDKIDDG